MHIPTTRDYTLYLYYVEKHSTRDEPFFKLTETEGMEPHGYTLVRKITVPVELPDMASLRQQRLAELEKMKREAREKFAQTIREIEDRIQSLLAIEMSPAATDTPEF